MYRDTLTSRNALYALAATQGGYFTAKQAAAVGYDYPHLTYHLKAGNFARVDHGLYRLSTVPVSEHDDLIRLSLWSRGRDDVPQAVVSHASALFHHGLSDVLDSKTHLTVPPTFRKGTPSGCVVHKGRLTPADTDVHEGYSVTRPLRTLCDVARVQGVTDEQLERAIGDALRRGLVRELVLRQELADVMSPSRLRRFLS